MELFKRRSLPSELLAEIRNLHFQTKRFADEGVIGQYRSAFRGHGIEFEELREYVPGDDIRSIDWKVTARLGRPYVKRYREERELSVMLAVDVSASTRTGTKSQVREEIVAQVAALLTLVALRNNDKVGLVTFSDRIETFHPPRKARSAVWRILHEVLSPEVSSSGTDIDGVCRFLNNVLGKPSIVFLISDFFATGYESSLALLAKRHDLTAVSVRDPGDTELPDLGLIRLRDPETGKACLVDTSDPIWRAEYLDNANAWREKAKHTFSKNRIGLLELYTDQPVIAPLKRYLRDRKS